MAKLIRPTETKIFGSTALAAELTPFGSSVPSTDINLILNSAEAQRGWGTIGANGFPPMEWFNALGYGLSYYNAYLMQQGIPEWTALQNYYINSYTIGSDGKLYRSKTGIDGTPNAGNTPVGDTVNWSAPISDTATSIHDAIAENPGDTDELGFWDSLSLSLRKVTLANLKTVLFGSAALTGNPTAPTPAQFDKDTSIANTAFIQRALGNMQNYFGLTVATTLTAEQIGSGIQLSGTGNYTITLPSAADIPLGGIFKFVATNNNIVITRAGTDTIGNNSGLNSITLNLGDTLELVCSTSTSWYVVGGSVALKSAMVFGSLLLAGGYQKLPSGLIIQWGTATGNATANTASPVTFPIAFPNSCLSIATNVANNNTTAITAAAYAKTVSGFTSYCSLANVQFNYIAIGY